MTGQLYLGTHLVLSINSTDDTIRREDNHTPWRKKNVSCCATNMFPLPVIFLVKGD